LLVLAKGKTKEEDRVEGELVVLAVDKRIKKGEDGSGSWGERKRDGERGRSGAIYRARVRLDGLRWAL